MAEKTISMKPDVFEQAARHYKRFIDTHGCNGSHLAPNKPFIWFKEIGEKGTYIMIMETFDWCNSPIREEKTLWSKTKVKGSAKKYDSFK